MIAVSVTEASQVAEARRSALATAQGSGFGEAAAGRVALVATELATNIIKHGSGGEILVGAYEDPSGAGVEVIALDRGKGIPNLQACLRDGFSTAGSSGNGLGAVFRQSHLVDVAAWPGLGTAVLARLENAAAPRAARAPTPPVPWGAVCIPKPGEEACGDAWSTDDGRTGRTLIVADGLGHGPEAAEAATAAMRIFGQHKAGSLPEILEGIHGGLRATRGAAVSIGRFDANRGVLLFAGIGNVAGVIYCEGRLRRMVSLNGTAGLNARKVQVFEYPCDRGLLILHSDGLSSSWTLDRYPGLALAHPTLVAAVLYRDFGRRRDDATVLVGLLERRR